MLRRAGVLLCVLGLGAAAVTLVPTAATAAPITPPAVTAGKTYVALGDSYAAGFGIPTTAKTPDGASVTSTRTEYPGCEQTSADYPHLLAEQLGLVLTDVTCQGATTADFSGSQDVSGAGLGGPNPPAQLDVFKTVQPDVVTITIGGNDFGFSSIAQDCLAGTPGGPTASGALNCKSYFATTGAAQDPLKRLPTVLQNVATAIARVRAAAPNAKIAVIAYPAIAPDDAHVPVGGCFAGNLLPTGSVPPSAFPFTDVDVPYLQGLQQSLDNGIGEVAQAAGVAYADIYPASLAHSACQPESTRWVEPIVPDQTVAPGSRNVLHPNVAGTTAMAAALAPVVTALLAPPATTAPAPSTGAAASTAAGGSTQAAGTAPLANTGPGVPVAWLLGLAGVLLLSGGVALGAARQKRTAQH